MMKLAPIRFEESEFGFPAYALHSQCISEKMVIPVFKNAGTWVARKFI